MALPGHSPPPPFHASGSPTRIHKGHMIDSQLAPMYGASTRAMLPPSPPTYRFPNPPPIPIPSPSLPMMHDQRSAPPYKRPGSSMSISSMLGGDPEKPAQEMYSNHNSRAPSRQGSISAPVPTSLPVMSPPQHLSKPSFGDYSYRPRSQTPDKIGPLLNTVGARQRSSSSGTPLQQPTPLFESHPRSELAIPEPRFSEQSLSVSYNGVNGVDADRTEHQERVRRTSLSGILQPPNSQSLGGQQLHQMQDAPRQHNATFSLVPDRQPRPDIPAANQPQRNGTGAIYDTKPPPQNNGLSLKPQRSPARMPVAPNSPESHRASINGNQGRTLASILNGHPTHLPESTGVVSHPMARQDSTNSQSDRSVPGPHGKFRQYSPFAASFSPQVPTPPGLPVDEHGRKGSDELTQHRAILGLAAESKKGRFSPMPQVMQGAQAQTPVPDAGVKTEHGRVFSGLGGSIGSTPTPVGGTSRREDGRTPLSEDNLMKISRSTPGLSKRSRKLHEDDTGAEPDLTNGSRALGSRANKKSKYNNHSHKVDSEDLPSSGGYRRSTPLTNLNPNRNFSATSTTSLGGANAASHSQSTRAFENIPVFKPKTTIKISSIFDAVSKAPRSHLGNFTYRPHIAPSDFRKAKPRKFDISITPNILPCFSGPDHANCTYTVHVPRMWLQERELGLLCAEQHLWGSGIYSDDSDPVAAAIHSGFLKASFGDVADTALLSRIVQEQNPTIDWPEEVKVPKQPVEIEAGKDLNITLLVLPLLERYEGSTRFGIRSRTWPERSEKTRHDGVSFSVLKIEFVSIGVEEMRMGRTGASRRERLRMDLEARQRGLQMQQERIQRVTQKRLNLNRSRNHYPNANTKKRSMATSVPVTITNRNGTTLAQQVLSLTA